MIQAVSEVDTELRYNNQVIATRFIGQVGKEHVCSVIREWSYLLQQHDSIHCVIFDFSKAYFSGQSRQALLDIAVRTHLLRATKRNIKVLGVCPGQHEYLLAKHWADYAMNVHSIRYGQVNLFRSNDQALPHVKALLADNDKCSTVPSGATALA